MHRFSLVTVASVVAAFGFVAFSAGDARADDTTAASPAAPAATAAPAPSEKPEAAEEKEAIKRFSVELNPLGVAIGRYSISGEYMLAKHHAVTLTPFFAHVPMTVTVNGSDKDAGSLTGFGGEVGYRFYTGSRGANGFFVGPSALFASYSQSAPGGASSDSFTAIGGAVDLGGQVIIGPGVVIGAGAGLQYTANSIDINTDNLNLASAAIAGGGVRPRFLLALGYSF